MIDEEVIEFIKDAMLTDPTLDAEWIYLCAKYAKEDLYVYNYLNQWMKGDEFILFSLRNRINYLLTVKSLIFNSA